MDSPGKCRSLCERQAVANAVRLLVGKGNVTELRALEATIAGERRPLTIFGYFDEPDKLAESVERITSAKGIYIVPNAVNPALQARASNRIKPAGKGDATQDTDIIRRRWLLIDCDPKRPANISASDAEHEAALQRARDVFAYLQALGWPDPIAADSGNGAHLLYRIDVPADDGGIVQRCLQALAKRFNDDAVTVDETVFNPARIWKLYGSLACKGDDVPDRPWRMASILHTPADLQMVPGELLYDLAAEPEPPKSTNATRNGEAFNLDDFIKRYGFALTGPEDWNGRQGRGRRWTFTQSPMCDHHDGAAHLEQHCSGAISAGCHHNSCSWDWSELRQKYEPFRPSQQSSNGKTKIPKPLVPTPAWLPFPVDILPEPIGSFVQDGSKAIGCDPSYIALPLLVACGAAIGNTRRLLLKRGWLAPPILWAAIVGESGTTKTPAFKLVMKPFRDRQRKALERHAHDLHEYEAELARWERENVLWKRQKGDEDPPNKPEYPQAVRNIVSDTTVEGLAPLLLANPRGLLAARDELAGWIGSFDRYAGGKGGDASHWLSMYDADGIIIDRKTGVPRTLFVPCAAVSVVGGIQPGILRRALGVEHRESGLAARLLLTCPPRMAKRWLDDDIDPAAEQELARIVERLYELQYTTDADGNQNPVVLGLSRDAHRLWRDYYNEHGQEQVELHGDLAAAFSKLEAIPARLALVLHCVERAAGGVNQPEPDRVDIDTMSTAIQLAEWFKQETKRVYAILGEDNEQAATRELLEWIDRKGGIVTARDLQQGPRCYRGSQDAAEHALEELVKAEHGTWVEVPTTAQGGRPTRAFRSHHCGNGNATYQISGKRLVS